MYSTLHLHWNPAARHLLICHSALKMKVYKNSRRLCWNAENRPLYLSSSHIHWSHSWPKWSGRRDTTRLSSVSCSYSLYMQKRASSGNAIGVKVSRQTILGFFITFKEWNGFIWNRPLQSGKASCSQRIPLSWWKVRRDTYPNLYAMGKKYLEIVASSVPSDRLFSN